MCMHVLGYSALMCLCMQHSEVMPCCSSKSTCNAKWKTPPAKSSFLLQILTGCHRGTSEGSELHTQRTRKWHPAVKSIQGCFGASQVMKTNQCHECESRQLFSDLLTVWWPSESQYLNEMTWSGKKSVIGHRHSVERFIQKIFSLCQIRDWFIVIQKW